MMKALVVSSLLLIAAVSAHAQSSYQQTYNATRDAIQSAQLVQDSLNRANAPKQYTQADLSTDAGRKVYLMEHPQYPNQYSGTDGARKLQEDADKLAGKPSGGQGLYALLKPANPSLTSDDLKSMGEPDVRKLFYNKYRAEGKSMQEARAMSEQVAIPAR